MNEQLIRRVKNSLNAQFYYMNDSWLSDCIEYYLQEHQNSTQDEIIAFVINQWLLCDLREINNEKGCLPRDLGNQKSTSLSGKYILQMDKLYDISQSKFKQLEKIRNVSSENVEATENENKQDDKIENWEPKSKRMLQLFLTDGIQEVLAIEYKPIRFLKDSLYPGYKLLIKGPVTCRRGVILLEENNISEVGGEVDSLLIVNAVENIFARALNLEENPDPYNDNNKQIQITQNDKSSKRANQMEDEFDINTDVIDQIDRQIPQQNFSDIKSAVKTNTTYKKKSIPECNNSAENYHTLNYGFNYQNPNCNITTQSKSQSLLDSHKQSQTEKQSYNCNVQGTLYYFEDDEDDGDLILNMVDEKALENVSSLKPIPTIQQKSMTSNKSDSSRVTQNKNFDEFPVENEVYDFVEEQSARITATHASTSSHKASRNKQSSTNKKIELIPEDDFGMNDFDIKADDFKEHFSDNYEQQSETNGTKVNQLSSKSNSKNSEKEEHSNETIKKKFNTVKENIYDIDYDVDDLPYSNKKNEISSSMVQKSNQALASVNKKKVRSTSPEFSGVKRPASTISPVQPGPQKIRCLQSTPKDKSNNKKITDFLSKPSKLESLKSKSPTSTSKENKSTSLKSQESSSITLLSENVVQICEFIKDVLKESLKGKQIHTVIRGKAVNIVKLNLLKNEKGNYFYLEGTVTDDTENLDVVFSSQVLEEIIGYNTQVFIQKRKQSKSNPAIKDELREDLKKAQEKLRFLDVLMEIKYKINERALIVKIKQLSKEERKYLDLRRLTS